MRGIIRKGVASFAARRAGRKAAKYAVERAQEELERQARLREYRREASRLVSLANKRVQRLEKNGLQDTPAYKAYIETGGKFGVKGKDHNELQKEVARLERFINSTTSTIKGVNNVLKDMADNTGIHYENFADLRAKAPKFFELANKVEQYLRNVDDIASAIGYQKIWTTINQYTDAGEIDLSNSDVDIDAMVEIVTNALKEFDNKPSAPKNNWFKLR